MRLGGTRIFRQKAVRVGQKKQIFHGTINNARIVIAEDGDDYRGTVFRKGEPYEEHSDTDVESLKAMLLNLAGTLHPNYVAIEGAIGRFRSFFDDEFFDPAYRDRERDHKFAVRNELAEALPLEMALDADESTAADARKALKTNMLSRFEIAQLHELLGSEHAGRFVQAAARFAASDAGDGTALATMAAAIAPFGNASWAMVTYLTYFWRPDVHMFLKPEATRDFAARIGDRFDREYESSLDPDVYSSLLRMTDETHRAIHALDPADRIDVQSFIWVVGAYRDEHREEILAWKRDQA